MYKLIFFIFGLVIGSFLNCLIYWLESENKLVSGKERTSLLGRSFCPHCGHQLAWHDLIPVLSFIFLKGKCRYCKKPISWQYPLVETATGVLFVLVTTYSHQFLIYNTYFFLDLIYYLLIACFLIVIFVFDFKHYIIPDKVIYSSIVITLIYDFQYLFLGQSLVFRNFVLTALGASLFFLLIFLITRGRAMGFGDVKLAFFVGLFLGWPNTLVAIFLSFLIGAIIGVGLILAGKKGLKSEVPFGPFLVTATLITLFWGTQIINWYLGL